MDRSAPANERAMAWRNMGRATTMLRTSSDGADVTVEENGMEWEVINPHGTGKGRRAVDREKLPELQRRCDDAREQPFRTLMVLQAFIAGSNGVHRYAGVPSVRACVIEACLS